MLKDIIERLKLKGEKDKMGLRIVRLTDSKKKALREAKATNRSLAKRNIKREAYVTPISQAYVQRRLRKGFKAKKRNYAIAMRDIRKRRKR